MAERTRQNHSDTAPDNRDVSVLNERLRALARHLVRDPALAEDLVQDAWLAVFTRPRGSIAELAPWLRAVVRNLAARRAVRDRARASAEFEAARNETVESDHGRSSPRDVLHSLRSAAEELHEPARSVIVLHYFESMTLEHVARRLDRPLETVRSQRRRGLADLRAILDRRHRGDRNEWLAALTPLVGLKFVRRTRLRSWSVAAVVTFALIFLGAWFAQIRRDDGSTLAASKPITESVDARSDVRSVESGARSEPVGADTFPTEPKLQPTHIDAPAAAAPTVRFACKVVDGDGRPMAQAHVHAIAARGSRLGPVVTDAEGLVELSVARADLNFGAQFATNGGVLLFARASGRAQSNLVLVEATDERCEVELVVDGPGQALVGRVLDELGQPIPGAIVEVDHAQKHLMRRADQRVEFEDMPKAKSDTQGRFKLSFLPLRDHRWVSRANGFAPRSGSIAGASQELELDIVLSRGRQIVGTVVLSDGSRAAGARVWVAESAGASLGTPSTTADEAGHYTLTGIGEARVRLFAQASAPDPSFGDALFEFEDESETAVCDLLIGPREPLHIRLFDAAGDPCVGALITIETTGGAKSPWRASAATDRLGVARFAHYPNTQLSLSATPSNGSGSALRHRFDPGSTNKLELQIDLGLEREATTVRGFVLSGTNSNNAVRVFGLLVADNSKLYGQIDAKTGELRSLQVPPGERVFFAADDHGVTMLARADLKGEREFDLGVHTLGPVHSVRIEWPENRGLDLVWTVQVSLPISDGAAVERLFDVPRTRDTLMLRAGEYTLVGRTPSGDHRASIAFTVKPDSETVVRVP